MPSALDGRDVPEWGSDEELLARQERLGQEQPPAWTPGPGLLMGAGCFVAFARGEQGPGHEGDHAWVGAVLVGEDGRTVVQAVVTGQAGAPYAPGMLARREGTMSLRALEALLGRPDGVSDLLPDVLLVDATGRDHPRRAGLALHLGAILGVPSIGVTHRPLVARGEEQGLEARGSWSPVLLDGEEVARWVCTRSGVRPVVAHAGWRTSPETAAEVVLRFATQARTPEPLRLARCCAREARSASTTGSVARSGSVARLVVGDRGPE